MTTVRVSIQWTETAKQALKKLPKDVRRGLLDKADELLDNGDPREFHKPLQGPLQGHYRITYGRYRAVYTVGDVDELASGDKLVHLKVLFIAAGIRKEHDRNDVYRVAEKLVRAFLKHDSGEPLDMREKVRVKKKKKKPD